MRNSVIDKYKELVNVGTLRMWHGSRGMQAMWGNLLQNLKDEQLLEVSYMYKESFRI